MTNRRCPNSVCPAHGRVGGENIVIHGFYRTRSGKRRRYRCRACGRTFSSTTGTPYYRLQHRRARFDAVVALRVEGVNISAISEFPKWRKYLILLSFLDNSSARPVQIGGVDVNICHSRVDRSPRTPAVQFAIPSAGAILSHTDGPCGS